MVSIDQNFPKRLQSLQSFSYSSHSAPEVEVVFLELPNIGVRSEPRLMWQFQPCHVKCHMCYYSSVHCLWYMVYALHISSMLVFSRIISWMIRVFFKEHPITKRVIGDTGIILILPFHDQPQKWDRKGLSRDRSVWSTHAPTRYHLLWTIHYIGTVYIVVQYGTESL